MLHDILQSYRLTKYPMFLYDWRTIQYLHKIKLVLSFKSLTIFYICHQLFICQPDFYCLLWQSSFVSQLANFTLFTVVIALVRHAGGPVIKNGNQNALIAGVFKSIIKGMKINPLLTKLVPGHCGKILAIDMCIDLAAFDLCYRELGPILS